MTTEMVSSFTAGITDIQGDVISLLVVVIPIALVLFGIMLAIRFGKRAFRTLSK